MSTKCYISTTRLPSCISGPDHLCSDGKCYSQSECPTGHTVISYNSCSCNTSCTGTCPSCLSGLQVIYERKLKKC